MFGRKPEQNVQQTLGGGKVEPKTTGMPYGPNAPLQILVKGGQVTHNAHVGRHGGSLDRCSGQ
jgi:hypothetical protein